MGYIQENQVLLYEELCAKPYDEEDRRVRATKLFRENIRLANHIAYKIPEPLDSSIDKEDLLQEGYIGLWKACLNFDESRGFEFSTYAYPMIKGEIYRFLRDTNLLKIPRWFKDIRGTLHRLNFKLPLSDHEIDIILKEGKFSLKQIMEYSEPEVASLDYEITEESSTDMYNFVPCYEENFFDLSEDEIEELVDGILFYLKPTVRDLVEEWMYATLEGEKLSQAQLGIKYKLSQVQVSRILTSAMSIIRSSESKIYPLFGV